MRPPWMNPPYEGCCVSLGGYVALTNVGASYDAIAQARGLGNVLIDFTNVTTIDFRVMVNKIGTGTQDWQLWNETDGTQIDVISDTGASGNKTLSTTINSPGLSGLKLIRVRARSSVAADDPVYYGGCIWLG